MRINLEQLKNRGIEVEMTETHVEFLSYNQDIKPVEDLIRKYGITSPMAQDALLGATLQAIRQAIVLDCVES